MVLAGVVVGAVNASAGTDQRRVGATVGDVSVDAMKAHLTRFQAIASAHGGHRAAGTPGYDASVDYVVRFMRDHGYTVTRQEFNFDFFGETAPPRVERVSPDPRVFTGADNVETHLYSGGGDVTAPIQPVRVTVPPTPEPSSASGCDPADFAGFAAGNIALVQRGGCPFAVKVANAVAAGARAVMIFNEGQPGRTAPAPGTLGAPVSVPVVALSFAVGEELVRSAQAGPVTGRVRTTVINEVRRTFNVLADSPTGDAARVVMAGAHLDSVDKGPGINDNGSGVAALLEIAAKLHGRPTNQRVRFAFWGAEEYFLLGSAHYVRKLTPAQSAAVRMYLNFDMIASPNFGRFVYDGDNSEGVGAPAGPPGSAQIERAFQDAYAADGLPTLPEDLVPVTDHQPFIEIGVPAGGVFSGIDRPKTAQEAALFGGTAGAPLDPCYHRACDTIANISTTALKQNGRAMATVIGRYALDISDIPPRPSPALARTADPAHHDAA
jgi:aminopeptidase Y